MQKNRLGAALVVVNFVIFLIKTDKTPTETYLNSNPFDLKN